VRLSKEAARRRAIKQQHQALLLNKNKSSGHGQHGSGSGGARYHQAPATSDEREARASSRGYGSSSNLLLQSSRNGGGGAIPSSIRSSRRDRIAPEGPRRMLQSESASVVAKQQQHHSSSTKNYENGGANGEGGSSAMGMTSDNGKGGNSSPRSSRRRKSKSKKHLRVEISAGHHDSKGDWATTPNTAASSAQNSPASSTPGVRGDGDYRSPGAKRTPKVASASVSDGGAGADSNTIQQHQQAGGGAGANAPLPDFITQTDRFGNASTPRSQNAIQKARHMHPEAPKPHLHVGRDGKLHEDDEDEQDADKSVDACTETFLDSLRLMCCCLMPDDDGSGKGGGGCSSSSSPSNQIVKSQITEEDILDDVERPRLLPKIHPDDNGKKCLVLDLDETLVHSSFRAVPGADFVIPVQVCVTLMNCDIHIELWIQPLLPIVDICLP